MQLVAWEAGVGSCIYTVDEPAVDEFLDVPPGHDLTAVVGFGYPTFDVADVEGHKDRRPLSEIAFGERFGEELELS